MSARPAAAALLVVFSCAYFASMVAAARHAPLSSDEVFVAWTLRVIPAEQLSGALASGVDSLPPGYYLFLKGVASRFGTGPLVIRLPSIVGFYLFLLSIFVLLRRQVGLPIAACAMALPCATAAFDAAPLARPYAIVCAAFGWAIVLWNRGDAFAGRTRRAVALAALLAAAIAVHFYATLLVVTMGVMELVRTARYRVWRWPIWCALVAGGASVLLWWSVIAPVYEWTHASTAAPAYYAKPSLMALPGMLQQLVMHVRLWMLVLIGAGFILLVRVVPPLRRVAPLQGDERIDRAGVPGDLDIAALGAMLLPAVTFLFALLVTGVFNTRYVYAAVLGVAIAGALVLRRLPYGAALSVLLLAAVTGLVLLDVVQGPVGRDARVEFVSRAPGTLPILVSAGSDFFEIVENAPDRVRARIAFAGLPKGTPIADPEPERMVRAWKAFRPELAVFEAEDWFARVPRFYVFCSGNPREAMTGWLVRHARVTVVDREAGFWLLEADVTAIQDRPAAGR